MTKPDNKLYLSGVAVYKRPAPPPAVQRRMAARARYEAEMELSLEPHAARGPLRRAIELLVDAFLLDRRGNAACFVQAHQLGRQLNERFGCPFREDDGLWKNDCGVLALHSRVGQSAGGVAHTRCSICGEGAFGCDHIADELYEGRRCIHIVERWDIEEISLTAWPRDPRCYRLTLPKTTAQVEETLGHRLPLGAIPTCRHCRDCPGTPAEDDLDASAFPALPSG